MNPKIEELKNKGWEFRTDKFIHPHANTEVITDFFKSPRMTGWATYYPKTDLNEAELNMLVSQSYNDAINDIRSDIEKQLKEYWSDPNQINQPTVTVNIK